MNEKRRKLGGRPPKFDETMIKTAIFLRPKQIEWLDSVADREGVTRTDIIRDLIDAEMDQGLAPRSSP